MTTLTQEAYNNVQDILDTYGQREDGTVYRLKDGYEGFVGGAYLRFNHKLESGLVPIIKAHRVAFILNHGRDVQEGMTVDHIDRNPLNNHISNLREVTQSENNLNRGIRRDNSSGFPGVVYRGAENRYLARLRFTIDGEKFEKCGKFYKDPAEAYLERYQMLVENKLDELKRDEIAEYMPKAILRVYGSVEL